MVPGALTTALPAPMVGELGVGRALAVEAMRWVLGAALGVLLAGCVGRGDATVPPQLEHSPAVVALAVPIAAALPRDEPIPDVPDSWSIDYAYALQKAVVMRIAPFTLTAGYKAGLMDEASRARFGVGAPVSGVLFTAGQLAAGATLAADADDRLVAELEIGFVLARDVVGPLAEHMDPFELVREVVPVVELPNLNLAAPPSAADVIGSNVSAWRFIVGAARPPLEGMGANALQSRLLRDGNVVAEGRGDAVYGDQRAALRWLINDRIYRGAGITAGQLLITGTMTPATALAPGRYRAEFGELGVLEFTVIADPAAPSG